MKSNLNGPYVLSYDLLEKVVPRAMVGVYALGHVDMEGRFRVERVGRDDRDLRECLRSLIGSGNEFKFATSANVLEAFERECDLFHRLRPPCNIMHPDRPPGTDWKCPRCVQFHL